MRFQPADLLIIVAPSALCLTCPRSQPCFVHRLGVQREFDLPIISVALFPWLLCGHLPITTLYSLPAIGLLPAMSAVSLIFYLYYVIMISLDFILQGAGKGFQQIQRRHGHGGSQETRKKHVSRNSQVS